MAEERKVLHVTNITHEATEHELTDLFGIAGIVEKVNIIRKGFPYYAFVKFDEAGDARRALNINGKNLGSSKISVTYSRQPYPETQPPPSLMPSRYGNVNAPLLQPAFGQQRVQMNPPPPANSSEVVEVHLGNIPVTMKAHNLHQLFSEFGNIGGVSLFKDTSGLATGTGKVSFTSLESASRASAEMNGMRLTGSYKPLTCSLSKNTFNGAPVTDLRQRMQHSDLRLTVQNNQARHHPYQIPNRHPHPGVTQEHIMDHTAMNPLHQQPPRQQPPPHQPPPHQPPPHQPQSQQPHFRYPGTLEPAGYPQGPPPPNYNMHGAPPLQQPLMEVPGREPPKARPVAIYVAGLPETSCKNCLLYQLFSPYGCVISVKSMESKTDTPGKPKSWFGFVNYKDIQGATIACQTLDKSTLDGQVLKVQIKGDRARDVSRNIAGAGPRPQRFPIRA